MKPTKYYFVSIVIISNSLKRIWGICLYYYIVYIPQLNLFHRETNIFKAEIGIGVFPKKVAPWPKSEIIAYQKKHNSSQMILFEPIDSLS